MEQERIANAPATRYQLCSDTSMDVATGSLCGLWEDSVCIESIVRKAVADGRIKVRGVATVESWNSQGYSAGR